LRPTHDRHTSSPAESELEPTGSER